VISPSALSLMYPGTDLDGYSREEFIDDLLASTRPTCGAAWNSVRALGADRLHRRPPGLEDRSHRALLNSFVDAEQPGAVALLRSSSAPHRRAHLSRRRPRLDAQRRRRLRRAAAQPVRAQAGRFYIALAGEPDRERVLKIIAQHLKPDQTCSSAWSIPIDPVIETAEQVRDRCSRRPVTSRWRSWAPPTTAASRPSATTLSTTRDTAFAKIRARVEGTRLAAEILGGH
jgi:5-methyltetrahydropteroyltriglutamate--homocysteine methyltransferase